jgi:hypothetical protein
MGGCCGCAAYCTRNVADEMFCWEMCGEERDLVGSGNGVYGGGGPRVAVLMAVVVVAVVVVVVVRAELRGRTSTGGPGGANGVFVKRKGPLGKAAAVVVEDARLRGRVLWPDDEARFRTVGVMVLRG